MVPHGGAAHAPSSRPACTMSTSVMVIKLSNMLWWKHRAAGGFLASYRGILVHKEGRSLFIESLRSLPSSPARYSESKC